MERLAETVTAPAGVPRAEGNWTAVAQGILRRAENTAMPKRHPQLHRLAAAVRAVRGDAAVPGWVDPAAMARAREEGDPVRCWLVQDAERGCLRLQAEPAGPRQIALGEALTVDAGGVRVSRTKFGADRWLSAHSLPADLAPLTAPAALRLDTATEILEVAAVRRPRGAGGWWCGREGIEVVSPPLAGHRARWQGESLLAVLRPDAKPETVALAPQGEVALEGSEGATTLRFGIDVRFGVFADVSLATEHGNATQRLRWIEPGTFLMGSPEDELEREDPEGPRHPVTLTRGYWMADTACTQGLWQAVAGTNPSQFTGADLPVENVNWHDVQDFLRKLEGLLPGCRADLPTEAEWEYACRAGTTTPFSFGKTITTDEVNYDGNYPYAGGAKGKDRGKTVPVKSLPANVWGLYEMHGNVWEWCADGMRTYDGELQVDPRGPEGKEPRRADRGGSWISIARRARSACRDTFHPGLVYGFQGFRLCLRSIGPGQVQGRPGGPAGRAPGKRPPASPSPEAKPTRESGATQPPKQRRPRRKK
jgi:formylglycine-generating enzyme required for sulfatase activity